jgi:Tol biopolymer transport system component
VERPGDERYPSYSPDGRRLLFRGDTDGADVTGDEELFVLELESGAVTQLTDNASSTRARRGRPTAPGSPSTPTATATPRST